MDSRVDNVEREVTKLGVEMGTIRECLVEIQSWVRRKDEEEVGRTEMRSSENVRSQQEENPNGASESGNRNQTRSEMTGRKLEMPIFFGEDPYGWIFRVERYFHLNGITEEGKLTATAVCMEGEAINWFQWMESRASANSWAMFKLALLQRFSGSQELNPYESLMAMKQTGSVMEFRRQFKAVTALLVGKKEEILQAAFINGLKVEVRAEQFQIILVDEEEDDPYPIGGWKSVESEMEQRQEQVELSLSSVVGIHSPKTMKLKEESKSFGVRVGDGYSVRCEGECRNVCMELQGVTIIQNFFPFDMSSADVVLGIAWLETLGETTTDWRKQTMRFKLGDQIVCLSGDPSLNKTMVSLKAMIKAL
ncbi:uncharacterized protein LOC116141808 [Pistacia vera]|uniref:uncharacterized protein LOC116141808 n=1 Tax=Pistacia vera TaxID=55513 RepID=UPI00126331A5|nr:uncharacterized protein LOC116141808 [Pistacia vera]